MAAGIEELTPDEIEGFLAEQIVGRIGCHHDGSTYVVPVIYATMESLRGLARSETPTTATEAAP